MKVSAEHYSLLKSWMQKAMTENNVTKEVWESTYSGYTEQRKVWDLYHATLGNSIMAAQIIRPIFNIYDDAHIETAIKKIYKELN